MPTTIQLYTLDELKKEFPEGYAKAYKKWQDNQASSWYTPWAKEIYDSYQALAKQFGYEIRFSYSSHDTPTIKPIGSRQDIFRHEVFDTIRNLGYELDGNGNFKFTGLCKLTGYCADDDLLEYFWGQVTQGYSCSRSIIVTHDKVKELIEFEKDCQLSEEKMREVWENKLFTARGQMVNL